ncbi:MAG: aminotransferase class V-fold PLP-dependent enzyme [Planctomycetota bacterium]|nr:MAG: aminotransferase class V-fold PLP-dependent enzyme [Planctomycetota bacterium]REK25842.1 MAG: aminotransferase class V-fold PLP-dependent enzyme [Planctomycetota bacterium]REK37121.1 MAG: aminotransferase class V-fold PLP-dependent enzyme [Planctomycetota bacterium]
MPTRLYLDTARLGLIRPSAQQIQIDFIRFVAEEAGSMYFEQLLESGPEDWPKSLSDRFPTLAAWKGIAHLKCRLKQLAGASSDTRVLLANRSAQLMSLAAELLFRPCRNVLTTDLSWPNYQRILMHRSNRAGNYVTRVPIRTLILDDGISSSELVSLLIRHYVDRRCDGLFLPAVDYLGVRLPISDIVREMRRIADVRFVVIDGAQALGHVPVNLEEYDCDFFISGCHKWLRAYNPMGIGFSGNPRSADYVNETVHRMLMNQWLNDPLLRMTEEAEVGEKSRFGETVNLTPLFTCQAAVDDLLCQGRLSADVAQQLDSADRLSNMAPEAGWKPLAPQNDLRTGICLLKPASYGVDRLSPGNLRERFHQNGIALTAYRRGLIRLSMPSTPWTEVQWKTLVTAFRTHRSGQTCLFA